VGDLPDFTELLKNNSEFRPGIDGIPFIPITPKIPAANAAPGTTAVSTTSLVSTDTASTSKPNNSDSAGVNVLQMFKTPALLIIGGFVAYKLLRKK
jgi:hypothetical protein